MGRAAKVTSIDAVQAFANALRCFQDDASSALENLASEIHRATDWVQHGQKDHWALQIRRGYEQLSEAKANLQRSRVAKRVADHEPSCIEEKKALERAKRRLQLAQEKIETVRHWSYAIDRAIIEYKGCVGQLVTWLDADCPRALAALDRMSRTLESYVALESGMEDAKETSPPSPCDIPDADEQTHRRPAAGETDS